MGLKFSAPSADKIGRDLDRDSGGVISDIITGRLEPTAPVPDPIGQNMPRRESGAGTRRRPSPPAAQEPPEIEDDSDDPPHQVDSLA